MSPLYLASLRSTECTLKLSLPFGFHCAISAPSCVHTEQQMVFALAYNEAPFPPPWHYLIRPHSFIQFFFLFVLAFRSQILQHLLAAGAKVCVRDRDQAAPLHLAALSGSSVVLHLLILNGAGLEDRDSLHMTPLHYSTLKDNAEAAKLLLHYGADVDATERLGRTPLHLATERGHCKVAPFSHKSPCGLCTHLK